MSSHGHKGTQTFNIRGDLQIDFEDRGGLMGFELLPIEPGDEDKFEIITITHPERWHPRKFQTEVYKASTESKSDPMSSDTQETKKIKFSAISFEPSPEALNPKDTTDLLYSMTYE